jgi:hypothetical protein
MAEEEGGAAEEEALATGTFIFPAGPTDKYEGQWRARPLAEGEEPEPEKDEKNAGDGDADPGAALQGRKCPPPRALNPLMNLLKPKNPKTSNPKVPLLRPNPQTPTSKP